MYEIVPYVLVETCVLFSAKSLAIPKSASFTVKPLESAVVDFSKTFAPCSSDYNSVALRDIKNIVSDGHSEF